MGLFELGLLRLGLRSIGPFGFGPLETGPFPPPNVHFTFLAELFAIYFGSSCSPGSHKLNQTQ